MKLYVVRDNNRDYGCDDIRIYTNKDAAELAVRQMIVDDLIERGKDLNEFVKEVKKQEEFGCFDRIDAMDIVVTDTLGGRCFATEVEVCE